MSLFGILFSLNIHTGWIFIRSLNIRIVKVAWGTKIDIYLRALGVWEIAKLMANLLIVTKRWKKNTKW